MKDFGAAKARIQEAMVRNENSIDNWMNFPEKRRNTPEFKALYDEFIVLRYQYLDALKILENAEK